MSEANLNDILSGGGLSSLLQNPEVAAKLPRIMEALGPVISELRAEQSAENRHEEPSSENNSENNEEEGAILTLAPRAEKSSASQRRRALLCALEPYLSDSRREAMNSIGKILTLIDLLSEVM